MEAHGLYVLDLTSGVHLSYLAEGAANIVYCPVPPPASPSTEADIGFPIDEVDGALPSTPPPTETSTVALDPRLEGKLIRLRKGLSTTVPVTESYDHFYNVLRPLFLDSQLVGQTLFRISREVIIELNAELKCMEKERRRNVNRRGLYLDEDEGYGTLVSDMSSDESSTSIEFKPKWLLQSPSAPKGSKRCRTCALRAMKQAHAKTQGALNSGESKISFCPLSLVSGERPKVAAIVEQLLASSDYSDLDRMRVGAQLIEWIPRSLLLQRLKLLQEELDSVGVFDADLQSQKFSTAMTLRDCTFFLKVPRSCSGAIEARIGDLDLKSGRGGKAEYWRSTETRLINEGWYTCTEIGRRESVNGCFLAAV